MIQAVAVGLGAFRVFDFDGTAALRTLASHGRRERAMLLAALIEEGE